MVFRLVMLLQTFTCMNEASMFPFQICKAKKTIILVVMKPQFGFIVENRALKCNAYYVNTTWRRGMLTNWCTKKACVEILKTNE